MADGLLSIQEAIRNTRNKPRSSFELMDVLEQPIGSLRIQARTIPPFSIMTYNVALLVAPAPYLGTDRNGAIAEIIQRIRENKPDVIGLCEVFADGEREHITNMLRGDGYFFKDGPDIEGDPRSDGGLLILSRHPITNFHQNVYDKCAGSDCLALKGVLHIRISPSTYPVSWDIFLTHTNTGGGEVLRSQLAELYGMVAEYRDPNNPCIVMGDFNSDAENTEEYTNLIYLFDSAGTIVDLWKANHTDEKGFTFCRSNNFYAGAVPGDVSDYRLDYFLLKSGLSFIPIPKEIEILKWTHNGRQISDHYGLHAVFEQVLHVERDV